MRKLPTNVHHIVLNEGDDFGGRAQSLRSHTLVGILTPERNSAELKKNQRIFTPAVGPGLHSKISVIFTITSERAGRAGFF
jgi:hypothetical protein